MGQAARNAAMAQQSQLLRKADSDAQRLAIADRALARGDVRVAGVIYARLAAARVPTPSTETAKRRLARLQNEANEKLDDLDKKLKAARSTSSDYVSSGAGKATGDVGPTINRANAAQSAEAENADGSVLDPPVDEQAASAAADGRIIALFREYQRLINKYGALPKVGTQIHSHVEKLRHRPEYAAVLNELAAKSLWELGQRHERDDQLCCAYWVYKRAAELMPAPSAVLATNRFAELDKDPKVVASAEQCRELQWCHQAYLRAERLLELKPERAKEVFAEIVSRAPKDSEVYRESLKRIQ